MSVAVTYQVGVPATDALRVAAQEARYRQTSLEIIHVVESLNDTVIEQHRDGIAADIARDLDQAELGDIDWTLHVQTEDKALPQAVIDCLTQLGSDVLVIGARHRSAVGKLLLGSITQTILLSSPVPVLVVSPQPA